MMNKSIQRTKILRDLLLYKGRTLLVVLAIMVGVTTFGVMSYAQVALDTNVHETFLATDPTSGILTTSDFQEDLLGVVRQVPGVADVNPRRVMVVQFQSGSNPWKTVELHMIADFSNLSVGKLVYESGSQVPPPTGSFLLERSALAMFDVKAGDRVSVRLPGGKVVTMQIAGLVNDLGLIPSSAIPVGYAYVTPETMQQLGQPTAYNRLYVRVDRTLTTRPEVERVIAEVVKRVEQRGVTVQRSVVPNPWETPFESSANTALLLLTSLGILSLALSAFLVINIAAAVIAEQIRQIGVIKSLGGKTGQVVRLYLQMVFAYGFLALVIAVPVSLIGAYFLANFTAKQLDMDIVTFPIAPRVLILQFASAILLPMAAALIPILNGARITIRQAISSYGLTAASGGLLGRLSGLPGVVNMTIRTLFRRKVRIGLTLAALTLAGGMFIAVLGARRGLYQGIDAGQREWNYDVAVDLTQPYPISQAQNAIADLPDITYETWLLVDARRIFDDRVGGSFTLVGLPRDSTMVTPGIRAGQGMDALGAGKLFVSGETYELIQQPSIGSQVNLQIFDKQQSLDVVGVSMTRFVPLAYTDYQSLADVTGLSGLANRLVVRGPNNSPDAQSALEKDVLDRLDRAGMQVIRSETTTENRLEAESQVGNIVMLLIVSAGLIAAVGGLGLASAMGLNVLDRTREIGVLRSLGARSHVVQRMVIAEGVLIGLTSYLPGIVLSVPLTRWLDTTLGVELFRTPLDYFFEWQAVLLWGAIILIVSIVASLLPARFASNLTIRETLAYQG
jgi:putative ABC transport system permease protein